MAPFSFTVPAVDILVKAAILALMTRDENVPGLVGQVLNIPVTCHLQHFPANKYEYGSYQQNKDASVVDAPKMDWFWEQYLPKAEPEVYASPLLAKDLSKLPPARKYLI
jgi:acetyl esterase/lipase